MTPRGGHPAWIVAFGTQHVLVRAPSAAMAKSAVLERRPRLRPHAELVTVRPITAADIDHLEDFGGNLPKRADLHPSDAT